MSSIDQYFAVTHSLFLCAATCFVTFIQNHRFVWIATFMLFGLHTLVAHGLFDLNKNKILHLHSFFLMLSIASSLVFTLTTPNWQWIDITGCVFLWLSTLFFSFPFLTALYVIFCKRDQNVFVM